MIFAQIIATVAVALVWYAAIQESLRHSFTWGGLGGAFLTGSGAGYILVKIWQ